MSAAGTFPFYWTVETSIARGRLGPRIYRNPNWVTCGHSGYCSWAATHRLHACPDREPRRDGCCVLYTSMCGLYVHGMNRKLKESFKEVDRERLQNNKFMNIKYSLCLCEWMKICINCVVYKWKKIMSEIIEFVASESLKLHIDSLLQNEILFTRNIIYL